jgi:hypothetical protein
MKKSGLADSPFFVPPKQDEAPAPPPSRAADLNGRKKKPVKKAKKGKSIPQSTKRSTSQPTSQSTDRPIDQSTNQSTDRSTDPLTDVDALGPVVERPHAFYITQKVDRWLDESARYLKEKGMHKADRSVVVNALLHDPKHFLPSSLDQIRARLLAHLTNKSLKRSQSTG